MKKGPFLQSRLQSHLEKKNSSLLMKKIWSNYILIYILIRNQKTTLSFLKKNRVVKTYLRPNVM